jgi:hypothetical protein
MSPARTLGAARKKSAEPRTAFVIVRLRRGAGPYGAVPSSHDLRASILGIEA